MFVVVGEEHVAFLDVNTTRRTSTPTAVGEEHAAPTVRCCSTAFTPSPDEDIAREEADDEVEGFEGIQNGLRKPRFFNNGAQFQNDDLWGSSS